MMENSNGKEPGELNGENNELSLDFLNPQQIISQEYPSLTLRRWFAFILSI